MANQTSSSNQCVLYDALEHSVEAALEVYANVHRGSGHHSLASTWLYEQARARLLAYWGLDARDYTVIFGSPHRLQTLLAQLGSSRYYKLTSRELGLPLGLWALGVRRNVLPGGAPYQTGGGSIRLVSPGHVIWADAPERFEAGTPAIINALALVRALSLASHWESCGPAASVEELLYTDDFERVQGEELLTALRSSLIGRKRNVPTADGMRRYINLDNAASTPTFAPIWQTVRRVWQQPEGVQQAIIEEVKAIVARFLHAPATEYEIIFTSNASEALNLAARGLVIEPGVEPVVLNTVLEHHSNELPWRYLPGVTLLRLPVDASGFIDHALVKTQLHVYNAVKQHGRKRITWIAVSGLSNVLGTCNDLPALARLAHQYDARLLVDGAQLVAHRALDLLGGEIDAMAFAGHKAYAPFSSGGLVVRRGLLRWPAGELSGACASGEENVCGIAALGKAFTLLERIGMPVVEATERDLTRRLLAGLAALPNVEIFGLQDAGEPDFSARGGVVAFSVRNVPHNLVAQELAELGGIGIRCGCFCTHLLTKGLMHIHPLRSLAADLGVLLAPRFVTPLLPGLVRISLGLENESADIETCLQTLRRIVHARRPWPERVLGSTYNGTPFLPRTATGTLMQNFAIAAGGRVDNPVEGFQYPEINSN